MRATWVALLVAMMTLAGCVGDDDPSPVTDSDGDGVSDATEVAQGTDPQDPEDVPSPDPPVSGEHGTPDRTEGDVETEQQGSNWRAMKTITISNGAGAATSGTLDMDTSNGGIVQTGWQWDGYFLTAVLYATGATEQEARDNLENVRLDSTDALNGGTLDLSFDVTYDDGTNVPNIINIGGTGVNYGGSLAIAVPQDIAWSSDLDGTNGGIVSAGVSGPSLAADITNGGIEVSGWFSSMDLDTTNGGIAVQVPASSDYGYDATASATNGGIDIVLPDTEPVGEQDPGKSEHVRTRGFDSKSHQSTISADTTNGGVSIVGY